MGTLGKRLADDLKDAMRAGDTVRRDEIRGLMAALKTEGQTHLARQLEKKGLLPRDEKPFTAEQQAEVERVRASAELSDEQEHDVLLQRVKQHRQSIEAFQRGNRSDLVQAEEAQLQVLLGYLPEQVEGDALDGLIREAIDESGATTPRDQGRVMGLLSERLRGRADMRGVGVRVKALLSAAM